MRNCLPKFQNMLNFMSIVYDGGSVVRFAVTSVCHTRNNVKKIFDS